MYITVEMATSINGYIATKDGSEDFLSNRNYQIMIEFLKEYDCLVWGNTTFKNVKSWGKKYIDDLKNTLIIVFSKTKQKNYDNVIFCTGLEEFNNVCQKKNLNKIFISGGATINNIFLKNNLVDEIIINYNPYVLTEGIALLKGEYLEKPLKLNYVKQEQQDIVQISYKVIKN